jgi:hypothetical protein
MKSNDPVDRPARRIVETILSVPTPRRSAAATGEVGNPASPARSTTAPGVAYVILIAAYKCNNEITRLY